MPRPISWLPRLPDIRRSVANSIRSHYSRRDLEQLFELQPRAAQKLLELLPTTAVGTSRLVEREALIAFLERIHRSQDPSAELEAIRESKLVVSRRKLRTLIRRDTEPARLDSLPHNLTLSRCRLEVGFRTIEELAHTLYALAQAIEADGEEMARRYEVRAVIDDGPLERAELEAMMEELAAMEAAQPARP